MVAAFGTGQPDGDVRGGPASRCMICPMPADRLLLGLRAVLNLQACHHRFRYGRADIDVEGDDTKAGL